MKKIALAISGASGSIYAKLLLERMAQLPDIELSLVCSSNAKAVWEYELEESFPVLPGIREYGLQDYMAPFASGSSSFAGLIICPCSMGTLSRIAQGTSDSLITRAADVMLKERRKLILVLREAPYNLIHINNMKLVSEAGGIICPATPSFYSKPKTIQDVVATVIDRVLQLAGIATPGYRWQES